MKYFKASHAVNSRLGAIDVDIGACRLRFIAVYMPHGGCDDEEVEGNYVQLGGLVSGSTARNRKCIVVGDWNAVLGTTQAGDNSQIIGPYGIGTRSVRGEWLIHWASTYGLAVVNAMFEKYFDEQWTYQNAGTRRQLDYCLISADRFDWVVDAAACEDICVGVDHRTVKMTLEIHSRMNIDEGRRKRGAGGRRGWYPTDKQYYQDELNASLGSCRSDARISRVSSGKWLRSVTAEPRTYELTKIRYAPRYMN